MPRPAECLPKLLDPPNTGSSFLALPTHHYITEYSLAPSTRSQARPAANMPRCKSLLCGYASSPMLMQNAYDQQELRG